MKKTYLSPEASVALHADVGLLVPVDRDDVSPRVAGLLELHLAHRANVVFVLQREVRVGDDLRRVFWFVVPLLFGLLHRRPPLPPFRPLDTAVETAGAGL